MDVRRLILERVRQKGRLKVADVVKETGFSRVYVHRFFRDLVNERIIALVGKANQAHYVRGGEKNQEPRTSQMKAHRILRNRNLCENHTQECERECAVHDKSGKDMKGLRLVYNSKFIPPIKS